jgi:uncharacterized phage protein gp47/JayE
MSFKVPTLTEMHAFLNAMLRSLRPELNVGSRWSWHFKRNKVAAAVATDVHAHVAAIARDVMPDTATGDFATRWGAIVNVQKKGATPARKSSALRVTGTAAATVAVGNELVHQATGLRFQVNQAAAIPGVAPFQVDVDVVAIDVGSATRLAKGEKLAFTAPPAGINTIATLQLELDEDGFDAEQEAAYRLRYLARLGEPQSGGNQADFVAWALSVTGIDQAYCYPNRAGLGTVDVVGLHAGNGSDRILSADENAALLAVLKSKAPSQLGGQGGGLRVLTAQTNTQVLELTVTPTGAPDTDFDWDDSVPPTVVAWNAGTRALQLSARPASLQAGHRIILKSVATEQDGRQYKVEALSGGDTVILEVAPENAPAAPDLVYSGGPLVDPIRDALIAHVNGEIVYAGDGAPLPASKASSTVNLRVLAEGMGTANPGAKYGTWSGSLLRSVLSKIAMYARGARTCTVIEPAADFDAIDYAFPLDYKIGFATAVSVIVRRG